MNLLTQCRHQCRRQCRRHLHRTSAAVLLGLALALTAMMPASAAPDTPPQIPSLAHMPLILPGEIAQGMADGPTSNPLRAQSWTAILSEDFEGPWPGQGWVVFDNNAADNGEYFWARRDCRAHTGSFSAWGVGGGEDGSSLPCGAAYPNLADSWMIYGPFDLSQAAAAEMRFAFWLKTECVGENCAGKQDRLCVAAARNLEDEGFIVGRCYAGDTTVDPTADAGGWVQDQLNLAPLLDEPQVWIAFAFQSDESDALSGGAYVDDILIRKSNGEDYLLNFPILTVR